MLVLIVVLQALINNEYNIGITIDLGEKFGKKNVCFINLVPNTHIKKNEMIPIVIEILRIVQIDLLKRRKTLVFAIFSGILCYLFKYRQYSFLVFSLFLFLF